MTIDFSVDAMCTNADPIAGILLESKVLETINSLREWGGMCPFCPCLDLPLKIKSQKQFALLLPCVAVA